MGLFDKLFNSLSLKTDKDSPDPKLQPITTELLTRTSQDQVLYENWKKNENDKLLLEKWYSIYLIGKDLNVGSDQFSFLDNPSAKGVLYRINDELEAADSEEYSFMLDLFKEKVKSMGYLAYLSDRRIFERKTFLETIERHYLKPDFTKNTPPKCRQLYGNITLELAFKDDQPSYLKILTTTYSDSKFHSPLPFEEFMRRLFESKAT